MQVNISSVITKGAKIPHRWLVLFLLCIGFAIRVNNLSRKSLWNDELWTVFYVSKRYFSDSGSLLSYFRIKINENPPLYYLILRQWVRLFGDSEFSLRFPSVLFGVMGIALLYFFVRRNLNKKIALLSCFLLTFSPLHVALSQEARQYTLYLFLNLVSYFCFMEYINKKNTKWIILYALFTLMLLYTHYYSFFVLLAQNVTYLSIKWDKKAMQKWIIGQLFFVIGYLPWATIFLRQLESLSTGSWIMRTSLVQGLNDQFRYFTIRDNYLFLHFFWLTILLFGLLHIFSQSSRRLTILLMLWVSIPILLPLCISQITMPFFVPRYAFACYAPFIIILSLGFDYLRCKGSMLQRGVLLLGMSAVLLTVGNTSLFILSSTEYWREAFSLLSSNNGHKATEHSILISGTPAVLISVDYYFKGDYTWYTHKSFAQLNTSECPKDIIYLSRFPESFTHTNCKYAQKRIIYKSSPFVAEYSTQ